MDNKKFLEQLECTGIVPVIKLENTADAVNLAKALYDGGIRCAEVTFRAEGADKVISDMVKAYPDMLVGAGTVLTIDQCDRAIEAGAKFCVAPGLNPKVVEHCLKKGVPFTPGVANGSQIEQAMELGLDFVKFFPAEQAGGLPYIKAISAPYSSMKFMPTGGVNENNLNTYLSFKKIVCCGGSWIVPDKLVKAGDWDEITALCRSAVNKMLDFSIQHIGINCFGEKVQQETIDKFSGLFGWRQGPDDSRGFMDLFIEEYDSPEKGHIAIQTSNVRRAAFHLKNWGFALEMSDAGYDESGRMTCVYLKRKYAGFKVCVVEKK